MTRNEINKYQNEMGYFRTLNNHLTASPDYNTQGYPSYFSASVSRSATDTHMSHWKKRL
jgi:hypothetical protein